MHSMLCRWAIGLGVQGQRHPAHCLGALCRHVMHPAGGWGTCDASGHADTPTRWQGTGPVLGDGAEQLAQPLTPVMLPSFLSHAMHLLLER